MSATNQNEKDSDSLEEAWANGLESTGGNFTPPKTIRDGFEKGETVRPLSQDVPKHTLTIFDVAFLLQSWQAGHPATGGKGFWHCVSRLVSNPSSPRRIAYEVGEA